MKHHLVTQTTHQHLMVAGKILSGLRLLEKIKKASKNRPFNRSFYLQRGGFGQLAHISMKRGLSMSNKPKINIK